MIRQFLKSLAKKHLDLVDRGTAVAVEQSRDLVLSSNTQLAESNGELEKKCTSLQSQLGAARHQMDRITEKYPTIWLSGDAAQGVVRLPSLKIACEFYREENKFCVFVPWNEAAGKKPGQLVPPWLEVDETQPITTLMDSMPNRGILFKIPVKGWLDIVDLEQTGQHAEYSLSGRAVEKTRSFRCRRGINGLFRREVVVDPDHPGDSRYDKLFVNIMFCESELPRPELVTPATMADYFPAGGNMELDASRLWPDAQVYGTAPDRIFHWKIPVIHVDKPRLGYDKKTYIPPKPTNLIEGGVQKLTGLTS